MTGSENSNSSKNNAPDSTVPRTPNPTRVPSTHDYPGGWEGQQNIFEETIETTGSIPLESRTADTALVDTHTTDSHPSSPDNNSQLGSSSNSYSRTYADLRTSGYYNDYHDHHPHHNEVASLHDQELSGEIIRGPFGTINIEYREYASDEPSERETELRDFPDSIIEFIRNANARNMHHTYEDYISEVTFYQVYDEEQTDATSVDESLMELIALGLLVEREIEDPRITHTIDGIISTIDYSAFNGAIIVAPLSPELNREQRIIEAEEEDVQVGSVEELEDYEDEIQIQELQDYLLYVHFINNPEQVEVIPANEDVPDLDTDTSSMSFSHEEPQYDSDTFSFNSFDTLRFNSVWGSSSNQEDPTSPTPKRFIRSKMYRPKRFLGRVCDIADNIENYDELVAARKRKLGTKKNKVSQWFSNLFLRMKRKTDDHKLKEEVAKWVKEIDPEDFDDVLDYRQQVSQQNALINSFNN